MTQKVKINDIKLNPNNPRIIKNENFKKLVQSIKDFPEMLDIRPIVVNSDMIILGGNMRYKACKEAGLKEIPIIVASNLTPEQQKEFLIKDNVSGGEWDWVMLTNEWDTKSLTDWGMEVMAFETTPDYSILDDAGDDDADLSDMKKGVRKAIQIEFQPEHYDEAFELVKFWRERNAYVGQMLVELLRAEKQKISK